MLTIAEISNANPDYIVLAALVVFAMLAAYKLLNDTTDEEVIEPLAAQILLSSKEENPEVLPHSKDPATEFEQSIPFLKPDAPAPEIRETESSKRANQIAATPALTPDSAPQTVIATPQEAPIEAQSTSFQLRSTLEPNDVIISQLPQTLDWGGLVLVPDHHILAKAYNSDVKLLRIEAHPIDGDHVRVWARVENRTEREIATAIGCEFRGKRHDIERPQFSAVTLPPRGVVDAYFVSQMSQVHAYTLMVKR